MLALDVMLVDWGVITRGQLTLIFFCSFFQVRSLSACLLSCCFFPLASAISNFIRPLAAYMRKGTMVWPFILCWPKSLSICLLCKSNFRVRFGSGLEHIAVVSSGVICAPISQHAFDFIVI